MQHDLVISPFGATATDMIEVAHYAEELGFGGVWTYDHMTGSMLGRGASHDAFTILGAMAAVTERVRIGPLVANMVNRHPMQLAVAMVTLQSLSAGRAVLGIGAGASPGSRFATEQEAIGRRLLPGPQRRRQLVETIGVVRGLWHGCDRHVGEFFTVDESEPLGSHGDLPIIVGASGPETVALAAKHADGVNLAVGPDRLDGLLSLIDSSALPAGFEISTHSPADLAHPTGGCLLYTSPSPRDATLSRMPSSA